MAYDEFLAERIENTLKAKKVNFEAKKMMGGICYMVDDKMCIGVMKNELMARLDPLEDKQNLKQKGSHPMEFTGKRMKGYILIGPEGTDMDRDLEHWVDLCLAFNPTAKSSKKKK